MVLKSNLNMIQFLNLKDLNAVKIYRQLCEIHGPTLMSEGKVSSFTLAHYECCRKVIKICQYFMKRGAIGLNVQADDLV